MRSHVTFTTRRFNQTEVKPHFINDCCFGEGCLAWLIGELRARGWSDLTEPGRRIGDGRPAACATGAAICSASG
jgi:hypothetical protein